eukprot:1521251-Amphidinium_carterae.1
MAESLEQLLQEEADMPEEDWDNGHRKGFITKALAAWKTRRLLSSPSIEGADTLQEESAILTAHWGPIFGLEAEIDMEAWSSFEVHVPRLPWPSVRCDMAEIAGLLA